MVGGEVGGGTRMGGQWKEGRKEERVKGKDRERNNNRKERTKEGK